MPLECRRVRPRRLEPDTLSYLKEVTEMLTQPTEDTTDEDVQLLLWNVLEELAPRAASASSDRHAGELVEAFLPKMSDAQVRYLLSKMLGYTSHLWTNRYSSHVLQNMLSRCSAIVERELQQDGDADPEEEVDERLQDTPSLSDVIVTMVKEVEAEWLTLMNDVSASHVLRSVLALLAGKPLVPEKRGKKGKHRVVTFAEAREGSVVTYAVPPKFTELFTEILTEFQSCHLDQMMHLMYDPNSGPLISAALKLAPSKAKKSLAKHILQWDEEDEVAERSFHEYACDAVTSHFLETLFTTMDDKFFDKLYLRFLQGHLIEMAQHNIANYVVQNAVQRVATKDQALQVLQELEQSLWTLLSMGRPGVVWRLVEMCVRFNLHQRLVLEQLIEAVKKQESKKPEAVRKDFVASLLNLQLSTSATSNKVQLNVIGARIIEQLMKFEYGDWLAPVYQGVLSLNTVQLLALARDSTGSRCVIEPIWESTDEQTAWVRQQLFERFVGNFGSLALDRLGAFSVMKCYEPLPLAQKVVVADELMQVESQLSGSHFAQLVMNTCHLSEFKNNREKWESLYQKKAKIAELFRDVVDDEDNGAEGKKAKKKSKKSKKHEDEEDKPKKKKKRALPQEEDDEETQQSKRDAAASSADVTSIMAALRGGGASSGSKKSKKSKKQH